MTGLQAIRALDELCAWLNDFTRRVADYRATADPKALLELDLRRALGANYTAYARPLRRLLSSSLPNATLRT